MSKYSLIICFSIIFSGCSVLKEQKKLAEKSERYTANAISDLQNTNITNINFYIQKAEIKILNEGKENKLLGSLKFRTPGTYLFSIRNIAGIEAARIMIADDSVFINDRINKKLYYGSSENLSRKYGISFDLMPLMVGDYVDYTRNDNKEIECKNGKSTIKGNIDEKRIIYEVDCSNSKVTEAIIYANSEKEGLKFQMSKLVRIDSVCLPRLITVEDLNRETSITIKIDKIKLAGKENIDFVPGRNYERILLK